MGNAEIGIFIFLLILVISFILMLFKRYRKQLKILAKNINFEYFDSSEIDDRKVTYSMITFWYFGYIKKDNLYFFLSGEKNIYSHALLIEKNSSKFLDFKISPFAIAEFGGENIEFKVGTTKNDDFDSEFVITGKDKDRVANFLSHNRYLINLILQMTKEKKYIKIESFENKIWFRIIYSPKQEKSPLKCFEKLAEMEKEFNR